MKKLTIILLLITMILIGCNQSQANTRLQEYKMIGITLSNGTTLCKGCGVANITVLYNDNGDMKRIDSYYPIRVEGNILSSEFNTVAIEDGEIRYIKGDKGEVIHGEVIAYGTMGRFGDDFGFISTVDGKAQVYNTYDLYLDKGLNNLLGSIVQLGTNNNAIKIK